MKMGPDPSNAQNIVVGTKSAGTIIPLSASNPGGNIGALMQFRMQDIPTIENQIGRLAVVVSSQFNQQNKLGQDLNGTAGVNFFSTPSPSVIAATTNATTGGVAAETVSAIFSDTTKAQASDYRLQVVSGQYLLTRLSDGQQTTLSSLPGTPATVDGITISASGTPTNGDSFTIEPVRTGATNLAVSIAQPQQIAAASPVKTSIPATNTGSLTVSSLAVVGPNRDPNLTNPVTLSFAGPTSYSINGVAQTTPYQSGQPIQFNGWSLTLLGTPQSGDQVNVAANVGGTGDNTNALALAQLQNAVNAQSSLAGVNLDEEASKLLQYQQQYQAAAKVISIASTLFNQILSIGA